MRIAIFFFVFFLFSYHQELTAGQFRAIDSIKSMKSLYQLRSTHVEGESSKSKVLELNNLVVISSDFKTMRIYTHSIEKYSFELGAQYWKDGDGQGKYWIAEGRMDGSQAVRVVAFQEREELQWLRVDFPDIDYSVTYIGHVERYINSNVADFPLELRAPPLSLLPAEQCRAGLSFVSPK